LHREIALEKGYKLVFCFVKREPHHLVPGLRLRNNIPRFNFGSEQVDRQTERAEVLSSRQPAGTRYMI
jgi:hypothetical protein